MLAESGGLAPQPAKPIHLFSKQRPHLGGFTLQSGGEQWSCPTSLAARNGFQPITALRGFALHKKWRRREVTLPSGAWPPNPLQTGAGASSGFASESPRGRICTCVDPLRRRRPELLGHAEMERGSAEMAQPEQSEGSPSGCPLGGSSANKVDLAAGLPPTTQRSKRCMIIISPREEKSGPFTRTCTSISSFAGSRPV